MKHLLTALLVFMMQFHAAAQDITQLDNEVSVRFPATVQTTESDGGLLWISDLDAADPGKGRCMAMRMEAAQVGLSTEELKDYADKPDFRESFMNGLLKQLPGVQVTKQHILRKNGMTVYDILMEKDAPDENFIYKYIYALVYFREGAIYTVAVMEPEQTDSQAARQAFLNSFQTADRK